MPEQAFKEMWDTILQAQPWKGLVMNLRKDGKHYWVEVSIDPINEQGEFIRDNPEEIFGFFAVRREPTREEVTQAEELYKELRIKELENKKSLKDWEKELYDFLVSNKEF